MRTACLAKMTTRIDDMERARLYMDDAAVYRRTAAGEREVIYDGRGLAPTARRLLLLVNGETPLRHLLDMLEQYDAQMGKSVLQLVDEGLIEFRAE
jgi:hypothetical protein